MISFEEFDKIARLSRDCVITEKGADCEQSESNNPNPA